ncbi:hypothetical protein HDU81_004647 [Chytriomyces hyalinus]|nr:hypothetical protein HDU81_004647 [Chytriomyces hyalinus]
MSLLRFTATVSALPATSAVGAIPTPDFIQPGSTVLAPACEVALNNTIIAMFDCGLGYDATTDNVKSSVSWGSATMCMCTPDHRAVFSAAKSTCVKNASDAESMKDLVDENTPSILTRGEFAYASSIGETVSLLSLTNSEKAPLPPPASSSAFTKQPRLMSFFAETPTYDIVDPAEWTVAQTVAWLTGLNYPPQVVASFEGAGVDGMFLKVLSKNRESCKEALKNDFLVDNVRTRALLADSIVSLFEIRSDGLMAGELPGYSA